MSGEYGGPSPEEMGIKQENESNLELEQVEQEKNNLLEQIDAAITKYDDELFEKEANHIKELLDAGLNKDVGENKDAEFKSGYIKYLQIILESLERISDPAAANIANKETRIRLWREEAYRDVRMDNLTGRRIG